MDNLTFFSDWTLIITTINVYLSYQAAKNKTFHLNNSAMAWHHFIYTFSMLMNVITIVVYWSILHEVALK